MVGSWGTRLEFDMLLRDMTRKQTTVKQGKHSYRKAILTTTLANFSMHESIGFKCPSQGGCIGPWLLRCVTEYGSNDEV